MMRLRNKKWTVFFLAGLLILGIGVMVGVRNGSSAQNLKLPSASDAFVPEFEDDQQRESTTPEQETAGSEAKANIKIPGYSTIVITAGEERASVDFYNPEENNVYFRLTLLLSDAQEQIYQSKLLKPGQHLYEITLDRALEAGEYSMSIVYETFSTDGSYAPRNGASVACQLKVE